MMFRSLSVLAICLQMFALAGCQINIDTKPKTSSVNQIAPDNAELSALKDEIDELKKSNNQKVQRLESELEQLKAQKSIGQSKILPSHYEEARALAEEYVLEYTKIKDKSRVVFETLSEEQQSRGMFAQYSDGNNFSGNFLFDGEGSFSIEKNLKQWNQECDDLYIGDTKRFENSTVQFLLCLSRNEEYWPLFVRMIETDSDDSLAVTLLTEGLTVKSDNAAVLEAFVEANDKVRPF